MIDINILINLFTQFYYAKYLFIASIIMGIFMIIKKLMIGR